MEAQRGGFCQGTRGAGDPAGSWQLERIDQTNSALKRVAHLDTLVVDDEAVPGTTCLPRSYRRNVAR